MMAWTAATAVRRTLVACASGELGATSATGPPQAWVAQPRPSNSNPKTASSRDIGPDPTPPNDEAAHLHESDGPSHGWREGACATQSRTILPRHAAGEPTVSHSASDDAQPRESSLTSSAEPTMQNGFESSNASVTSAFRSVAAAF